MRIVSFNVNGLRTLRGYQPWYSKKDFEACLDFLEGDIVCFQETKMTRKQLDRQLAITPSFHSFFNFHPTKGYSGTATYVRKSVSIPLRAECGITGEWFPPKARGSGNDGSVIGGVPLDAKDELDTQLWQSLDLEGRSVVIDCGLFVLFNLYCPNLTGPERADYKKAFNRVLGERANRLLDEGREVIIVGDLNICYQPIDHADPEQSLKDHGIAEFGETPGRRWLKTMLDPASGGRFIDAARHCHPTRTKMFTCWNQKIDARPANYGTRIDFTLISKGLLGWLKSADIQADIYGSDHCPVYVELHDEREIDGRKVKLRDLMHGWDAAKEPSGPSARPPPLASCNEEEFSDKRRSIASFFTASTSRALPVVNQSTASPPLVQPKVPVQASSSMLSLPDEEPSVADAFSALQSVGDGSPGPARQETTAAEASTAGIDLEELPDAAQVSVASSGRAANSKQGSANGLSTLTGRSTQRRPSPPKGKASAKGLDSKQPTLAGFFNKGTKSPSNTSQSISGKVTSPSPSKDVRIANEASAGQASTQERTLVGTPIGSSQPTQEEDDPDSAAKRVGSALAWGSIFTAPPAPKCSLHGELAKSFTVNKAGKNHGRKFWLCARPVGPGYEKSGRNRNDVNPEYRCDYFVWDSDLRAGKAGSSAGAASSSAAGGTNGSGSGLKRPMPTATLSDVSRARQKKEAAEVVSLQKRAKSSHPSS
ncbi:hypothetical protein V8E36_007809 [Tilletia maclaganii]